MRILNFIYFIAIILTGCSFAPQNNTVSGASEQFYVDAKNNFTVNHLQDWWIENIPVSSPDFRTNMVSWVIDKDSPTECKMTIRVFTETGDKMLMDLFKTTAAPSKQINKKKLSPYKHSLGQAMQLRFITNHRAHDMIAIDGDVQNYLVSLDCELKGIALHRENFYDSVNSLASLKSDRQQ